MSLNGSQGFFRYSLYWSIEKDSNIIQLELKTNHEKTVEEQAILTPKNITASFYKEKYTSGIAGETLSQNYCRFYQERTHS